MATRKQNDFLNIESSDNDEGSERGYDSEQAEETKGRSERSVKRRKLSSDEESGDEGSDRENDEDVESELPSDHEERDDSPAEDEYYEDTENRATPTTTSKPTPKQSSSLKKPRKEKTGVIYFSSLPPYLKPTALNSMLTARGFGPITKVFLSPAVKPSSKPTGAGSGSSGKRNRRRMYSDGWVEFAYKRTAKICAETLNATIVGGKKGGWYHDDIWNMKYLRGFKWADLMEQVQREKREAEARRRVEDARARKEEKLFVSGVEKGRVVEGIKRKREEKGRRKNDRAAADDAGNGEEKQVAETQVRTPDVRRVFRQNEVRSGSERRKGEGEIDSDTRRVLGKIF